MARTKQTARKSHFDPRQGGKRIVNGKIIGVKVPIRLPAPPAPAPRRRTRPGLRALREIRKYQQSVHNLIRKKPFQRVVRDISRDPKVVPENLIDSLRWSNVAMEALQEAAESYLVRLFEKTNLAAIHARRVTISDRDMKFVQRIMDE